MYTGWDEIVDHFNMAKSFDDPRWHVYVNKDNFYIGYKFNDITYIKQYSEESYSLRLL